jgi:hypothetical protein
MKMHVIHLRNAQSKSFLKTHVVVVVGTDSITYKASYTYIRHLMFLLELLIFHNLHMACHALNMFPRVDAA